jgi:hypothetical protein
MKTIMSKWRRIAAACAGMATLIVAGLLASAQPASADDSGPTISPSACMQRVFIGPTGNVANSNLLNCTANDIRLSRAISVSQDSCIAGTTFDLTATFEVDVTANARYDAGFFFRTDGGPDARGDGTGATGECSLSALTPPPPPNPPALDLDGDSCGDLNSGTYNVTFTIPDVLCQDTNGDGFLNLPNCTSWHSNQGTVCDIDDQYTFDPDTKSKCVCDDTFQVPVTVEDAEIVVTKSAAPLQVPESGGTVTYTVIVENTASFESVEITSIIDDPYGDVGSNIPDRSPNDCPDLIGETLGPGDSLSCSFTAFAIGNANDTITDTVEVCAYQASTMATICNEDDAVVTIIDEFAEPTLTKTAQATANCQLDATYQVVVSNNSEFDALMVTALTDDKFGNIATVQGNVLDTGCEVPTAWIEPLGNYTCSFTGRITSTSCDINHTNMVTASTVDDDGVESSPSDDATVTVNTAP